MFKLTALRTAAVFLAMQSFFTLSASANELSYSNLALGYEIRDQDIGDVQGFTFELQLALSNDFYLTVRSSDLEDESSNAMLEDDEWTDFGIGLGFHLPLSEDSDIYGEVEYRDRDTEINGVSETEDGFAVGVGIRNKLSQYFEYDTGVTAVRLEERSTGEYHFGMRAFVRPSMSLGARITTSNRTSGVYQFDLRLDF